MTIWLDNQLPPALGSWAREHLGVDCTSVSELALQRASDLDIFHAARAAGALVMTKDADFAELVGRVRSRSLQQGDCGLTRDQRGKGQDDVGHVLGKLQADNRTQILVQALQSGVIALEELE